ncbi:MAG: peptide-methionine (S)-S-oxide reductase MsrA [Cyanobacteriota/Melainabacteria group bacterium]|nr:peptide-methionine (S)-S-oxide reductase MsrA [Candidatus Obscuribacterales bacterium]
MQTATFAAGCFWGVEAAFSKVDGVIDTKVGYAGGSTDNPTYEQVCSDQTGHAEVVKVEYDETKLSYQELLNIFFWCHDPTQLNRQGPDVGRQYRSAIFFHSPEQESLAKALIEEMNKSGELKAPVVTELLPAATFWLAEEYHQRYFEKKGVDMCHN